MSSSLSLVSEDATSDRPTRRILLTMVRLGVGLGLLAYLARSGIINLHALSRLYTAWPITLAALALLLADVALMGLRLCWLFVPQALHLPLGRSMQLTLVSFFFAMFLPGSAGGDLAKLFYAAKGNRGRRAEIITIMALDRGIGLFSLLILPLLFAPLFLPFIQARPALRILLITVALLAFGLLAAFLVCLLNPRAALRFFPRSSIFERIARTIRIYRQHLGTLVAALGASVVANLCLVAVTALAVLALNSGGLSMVMSLMIPLGHIVNSLPLTPGGLGVGETAFNALFSMAGLGGGAEALLCWRIWMALISILGLVFYLRGLRRCVFDAEKAGEERAQKSGSAGPVLCQP
jgi:glycosyltransferase 2 family protein